MFVQVKYFERMLKRPISVKPTKKIKTKSKYLWKSLTLFWTDWTMMKRIIFPFSYRGELEGIYWRWCFWQSFLHTYQDHPASPPSPQDCFKSTVGSISVRLWSQFVAATLGPSTSDSTSDKKILFKIQNLWSSI